MYVCIKILYMTQPLPPKLKTGSHYVIVIGLKLRDLSDLSRARIKGMCYHIRPGLGFNFLEILGLSFCPFPAWTDTCFIKCFWVFFTVKALGG